jgi:hypothetical protein
LRASGGGVFLFDPESFSPSIDFVLSVRFADNFLRARSTELSLVISLRVSLLASLLDSLLDSLSDFSFLLLDLLLDSCSLSPPLKTIYKNFPAFTKSNKILFPSQLSKLNKYYDVTNVKGNQNINPENVPR